MHALLLLSALVVGCLLAVQTSANLQLNKAVGTPYGASTLQLAVAAALLALLAAAAGALGALRLLPDVPAWHLLGGLASPLYITSGILLFPRLGALASVGLFVTGQVFASLALDLGGLLGVPRRSLTVGIALGAAAVLIGITTVVRGQRSSGTPAPAPPAPSGTTRVATAQPAVALAPVQQSGAARQWGWIVLGVLAGAVLPIQGAVNGNLRHDIVRPLAVATISFIVAVVSIGVLLGVLLALRRTPRPRLAGLRHMPWWGWVGGACAAAYVTATFLLIPVIGAATTVALTVTGQQAASAVIDKYGLLRLPARPLTAPRVTGLALLLTGSVLVQLG